MPVCPLPAPGWSAVVRDLVFEPSLRGAAFGLRAGLRADLLDPLAVVEERLDRGEVAAVVAAVGRRVPGTTCSGDVTSDVVGWSPPRDDLGRHALAPPLSNW